MSGQSTEVPRKIPSSSRNSGSRKLETDFNLEGWELVTRKSDGWVKVGNPSAHPPSTEPSKEPSTNSPTEAAAARPRGILTISGCVTALRDILTEEIQEKRSQKPGGAGSGTGADLSVEDTKILLDLKDLLDQVAEAQKSLANTDGSRPFLSWMSAFENAGKDTLAISKDFVSGLRKGSVGELSARSYANLWRDRGFN